MVSVVSPNVNPTELGDLSCSGKQGDPDMTNTVDVAAIQARVDAATPGEWFVVSENETVDGCAVEVVSVMVGEGEGPYSYIAIECEHGAADAEFIAHARADVPALLAENARVEADLAVAVHEATTTRAALERVRELLNSTKSWHTYEPRELGEAYLADTVNDFIDDLAAALSSTNTTHEEQQ